MSGSRSEKLTLFDFDDADDLAATDMMSMPVLTDPEVKLEHMGEWAGSSGRDGIEILEFRNATAFDMIISENLARFEKIIEGAREHRAVWAEGAAAHA